MKTARGFKYNANHFSLKIEEAAFAFSRIHSKTPENISLFPLLPDIGKRNVLTHMLCSRNKVDSHVFDANLCVDIYRNFCGDDVCENYPPESQKQISLLLEEINSLTNESILVKAAILNYGIVNAKIFPIKSRLIADVLSVIYLYKHKFLPTPYFYLDCEQLDKKFDERKILDIYIFDFLDLVTQQAGKHIEYLEKVSELRQEVSAVVYSCIHRPQSDKIIDLIFGTPIISADDISKELEITRGQAIRHLHVLEEKKVLVGDDKQRNRKFYFARLLDLMPK
jgi:hypothetical protein